MQVVFTARHSNARLHSHPYPSLSQLLSSAAEALANNVHDLLHPSLHLPARAAASDSNPAATPLKSRQQQQQQFCLQIPARNLPQEEDHVGGGPAGARAGGVAFKRRTVVTHSGGIVTSAAASAAAIAAETGASTVESGHGMDSSGDALLDDAMVESERLDSAAAAHALNLAQATAANPHPPRPALPSLSTYRILSRCVQPLLCYRKVIDHPCSLPVLARRLQLEGGCCMLGSHLLFNLQQQYHPHHPHPHHPHHHRHYHQFQSRQLFNNSFHRMPLRLFAEQPTLQ
jgi:hypothetical protein